MKTCTTVSAFLFLLSHFSTTVYVSACVNDTTVFSVNCSFAAYCDWISGGLRLFQGRCSSRYSGTYDFGGNGRNSRTGPYAGELFSLPLCPTQSPQHCLHFIYRFSLEHGSAIDANESNSLTLSMGDAFGSPKFVIWTLGSNSRPAHEVRDVYVPIVTNNSDYTLAFHGALQPHGVTIEICRITLSEFPCPPRTTLPSITTTASTKPDARDRPAETTSGDKQQNSSGKKDRPQTDANDSNNNKEDFNAGFSIPLSLILGIAAVLLLLLILLSLVFLGACLLKRRRQNAGGLAVWTGPKAVGRAKSRS